MLSIILSVITLLMSDIFDVQQKSPLTGTAQGITITAEKGDGQTKPQMLASGYFCVYAKGKLTISSTETMRTITFGSCDIKQLAKLTPSVGSMQQDVQTDPVWNGEATSVTFTISEKADYGKNTRDAGQLKFMTLKVAGDGGQDEPIDTTLVRGVDLYYGHYSGETPYTYYNHQLWLTSKDLTYDGQGIEGNDGHVMRLDLFSSSATDLCGTYTITDPNKSDHPGCINKKFTSYAYFQGGAFVENKLVEGTCTISCVTNTTYDITYDVKEITTYKRHQGTLRSIPISAITANDFSLENPVYVPYTLRPSCRDTEVETLQATPSMPYSKRIENGHLVIIRNNVRYSVMGQEF